MLPIDIQAQPAAGLGNRAPAGAGGDRDPTAAGGDHEPTAAGGNRAPATADDRRAPATDADRVAPAAAGAEQEPAPPPPSPASITSLADLLTTARRPAIIAGRGAVLADARDALERLGDRSGALLATSAPAHGLFARNPYSLGIAGGFASPLATELLPQADLILAFGASLNHWTTKHGAMIGAQARVVQIDIDPTALGRHRPVDLSIIGDARATAIALADELDHRRHHASEGFRTPDAADQIAAGHWRNQPYEDASTDQWIDPRTLTIALDELLPPERAVAVDSGHFLGYPSMYLDLPDPRAWVFVNGFQAVGLGLGNAIGAAVARPDRPTVAALGDGGAFMALAELETAARLKLKLLVLVYDDAAYGAEVHHFEPLGHDVSLVRFPDADLAAIARAAGAAAATIRRTGDLDIVQRWLDEAEPGPLVLDAKVNPTICAEWLEEAFRGG
ncbi:MAG: thiamine pyrophosphate-binding protein [Solirubrobacterales bacterium]|nr:thiamine pyrophosphate-binding protein [Solirubrobacterales bacterium]MBV9472648.1 thiamine pyrophosphate-binding protein [Solirubrobacterales bacterium]MBV9839029.1 thiamine pyrophosphate-binding protein [Solirubrobacterales bacterium]